MKNYCCGITFLLLLTTPSCYGQTASQEHQKLILSEVTVHMLDLQYNADERAELNLYPAKLASLEYLYARSYEFLPGQLITADQKRSINIDLYGLQRKPDERVTVFSEEAGVYIVLHSLDEMHAEMNRLLGYRLFPEGEEINKIN